MFWQRSLHDGVIADTTVRALHAELGRAGRNEWRSRIEASTARQPRRAGEFEIVFRPDPTIFDGRFANNGWLQELPKPITKLTWDNAALMSPATAEELGVSVTARVRRTAASTAHAIVDVVELTYRGRTVEAPVWIMPGHADGAITVHLGYGRHARRTRRRRASASTPTRCAPRTPRGSTRGLHGRKDRASSTRSPARSMHHIDGGPASRSARPRCDEYPRMPDFARRADRANRPEPSRAAQATRVDQRLEPLTIYPQRHESRTTATSGAWRST